VVEAKRNFLISRIQRYGQPCYHGCCARDEQQTHSADCAAQYMKPFCHYYSLLAIFVIIEGAALLVPSIITKKEQGARGVASLAKGQIGEKPKCRF